MNAIVVTVDQRGSRGAGDLVGAALEQLAGVPTLLAFERTAGDELQGVVDDPAALPLVLEPLLRAGAWSIGLGLGGIEEPLPDTARAGRGAAYLLAREAVEAAKRLPWHTCVRGADEDLAHALESALWLWASVLDRRTTGGWEVADLLDQGLTYGDAADRLGVSQPAVSQRARAAGITEGLRGRDLVSFLARQHLHGGKT